MDQVINLERVRSEQWYHELAQTDTGIDRIKLWSLQTGHLEADDLLISADVDEVMSARALQALKWCDTHEVRVVSVVTVVVLTEHQQNKLSVPPPSNKYLRANII